MITSKEIKVALAQKEWSQKDLAKAIGYAYGTVREAICKGKFSFELEFKIKQALEL